MIYGVYCKPQSSFAPPTSIYEGATVVLDFIAGIYRINGVNTALADMLSEVLTINASGMYVGEEEFSPFDTFLPPFLIGDALIAAAATLHGQFTLLFEYKDTIGFNSDSVAFGATQFSTGTANTDDFYINVGGVAAFVYDQIHEIPYIGNDRSAGGVVVEGTVKRLVVNRSPSLLLVYKDGAELNRDSLATIDLSGLHSIRIGGPADVATYDFSGYVRRVIFYPIKSEALLAQLSTG